MMPSSLVRAAARNHIAWFSLKGDVRQTDGVTWIDADDEVILPFPEIASSRAGAVLDAILAQCRVRPQRSVGVWSLLPSRPRDLGVRLLARGFERGWQPHWMGLELSQLRDDFSVPPDLTISIEDGQEWQVADLPYYDSRATQRYRLGASMAPRRVWHLVARQAETIVGHSVLHRHRGVAGIYDVGVVPAARRQGVGRAVSHAACALARERGCRYALLNAATTIYERLGFVSLGQGQTWWMHAPTLAAAPPSPERIAFAEAIGRGDLRALQTLPDGALPDNLDAPLPGGAPPMALAVQFAQPSAARWLVQRGATLDVVDAWDLGWRDEAAALLTAMPERANRRRGAGGLTPLHEAVLRNDTELLRLLLTAGPDTTIEDTQFHSTSLGWARHFQRDTMIALLERR